VNFFKYIIFHVRIRIRPVFGEKRNVNSCYKLFELPTSALKLQNNSTGVFRDCKTPDGFTLINFRHKCSVFNLIALQTNRKVLQIAISLYNNLLTYLLTPRCRVLLEKLTGLQQVKKFPAFYGARRFITALKSVRQLSLSSASPIQSIYPHPTSWRPILILSTHLRLGLPSGLLPSGFLAKTLYTHLSSPKRATRPAHLIVIHLPYMKYFK
jgi:hypothetical protein